MVEMRREKGGTVGKLGRQDHRYEQGEEDLLPPDGFQQTAALMIAAVAAQRSSDDRGASQALESLREIRRLASVWLQVNWDMDPYVRECVDQARIRLSQASQWLEDCDWTLCRTKEGRKRLREAKCTAIDVPEEISELLEGSGEAGQKKAEKAARGKGRGRGATPRHAPPPPEQRTPGGAIRNMDAG